MANPIPHRTIGAYLESLGSSSPTPGGGSAAGVIGALGCSLGMMVVAVTKPASTDADTALRRASDQLAALRGHFTTLAEQDEEAYQSYRDAAALPKSTSPEQEFRRVMMQRRLQHAARVPLSTALAAVELATHLEPVRQHGNPHLQSDTRIATLCASTCFDAALINVEVNLPMIRDAGVVLEMRSQLDEVTAKMQELLSP